MKIEINIRDTHVLIALLFITAASAIGLVAGYGGTAPATMGHTWGEMVCDTTFCMTGGNVGIGMTTPGQKLDVSGNVRATGGINATGDICTGMAGGKCLSATTTLDSQGRLRIGNGFIDYESGSSPGCPAGSGTPATRNWAPKTCDASGSCVICWVSVPYSGEELINSCGTSCTTPGGWGSTSTCTYTYEAATGTYGYCSSASATCTADTWTEVVCIGN